jgi:HlyD family secretion protein
LTQQSNDGSPLDSHQDYGEEQRTAAKSTSQLIRRQRVLIGVAAGAAVLSAAGLLFSLAVKSPAQEAADQAAPTRSVLTATVKDAVLKSSVTVRGTVAASNAVSLLPLASTSTSSEIVTGLPVAVGSTIDSGSVVAQVSGRPIIALPGSIPAYRDMKPGTKGADVSQLQTALVSLGYLRGAATGVFDAATKSATTALYEKRGFDPQTTSAVNSGEATELQSDEQAVTSAQQKIQADSLAVSQATDPSALAQDNLTLSFDRSDLATSETALTTFQSNTGVEIPLGEVVFVPSFPATVGSIGAQVGTSLSSSTGPWMTIDVGALAINAVIPSGSQSGIKASDPVTIDDDVNQRSTAGTVASLGSFSSGASGSSQGTSPSSSGSAAPSNATDQTSDQAGYPAIITPSAPLDSSWLGLNVSLTIVTGQTSGSVLTVPLIAIRSATNGTDFVTVRSQNGVEKRVPVTTGINASGEVQVTPKQSGHLAQGDKVVTG